MSNNTKKGFRMPNNYVVVFCIIVLAMLMTYIIPAGSYDRTQDLNTGAPSLSTAPSTMLTRPPFRPSASSLPSPTALPKWQTSSSS